MAAAALGARNAGGQSIGIRADHRELLNDPLPETPAFTTSGCCVSMN